ncbi:MAG TPA: nuclear transport factor 2 family protein [Pararhizobium sp.]|uniref:nuclear transport factor 2 family protein n=1 Tax=Pararhizobium sp. TaxID=1977563 RepID=UPI002BC44DBA|nr:nuclear transport factor 2 family protein [Pararhizobium sp.]HTO31037.1 nuclear transport factor 2 family protein [Pararhizobium sp.]
MSGIARTDQDFAAVMDVIARYFDGLHHSDTSVLKTVFHPKALYATATEGSLLELDMERYFPIVDKRASPASRGEARADRIISIEFAGPVTAFARVECAIGVKSFTDFLSLIRVDGRWQIIAKVFHYDMAA